MIAEFTPQQILAFGWLLFWGTAFCLMYQLIKSPKVPDPEEERRKETLREAIQEDEAYVWYLESLGRIAPRFKNQANLDLLAATRRRIKQNLALLQNKNLADDLVHQNQVCHND